MSFKDTVAGDISPLALRSNGRVMTPMRAPLRTAPTRVWRVWLSARA
jgi:hypothetical protein